MPVESRDFDFLCDVPNNNRFIVTSTSYEQAVGTETDGINFTGMRTKCMYRFTRFDIPDFLSRGPASRGNLCTIMIKPSIKDFSAMPL